MNLKLFKSGLVFFNWLQLTDDKLLLLLRVHLFYSWNVFTNSNKVILIKAKNCKRQGLIYFPPRYFAGVQLKWKLLKNDASKLHIN